MSRQEPVEGEPPVTERGGEERDRNLEATIRQRSQANAEMLRELDEVRDFRRSFPQRAESEVDRKMKETQQVAAAERRLQELLDSTLDAVTGAQAQQHAQGAQSSVEKKVTHSAKSIQAEQLIQRQLMQLKKTSFWEFRIKYLDELGPTILNALRVEMLSIDPEIVQEAIAHIATLATDWNDAVRETAVQQLANAATIEDRVAFDCLVGHSGGRSLTGLQDHSPSVRRQATESLLQMTERGDTSAKGERIITQVARVFESHSKAIRDCALAVVLHVAPPARAVEMLSKLLAGGPAGLDSPDVRTDLRIWAIDALAELAAETSASTAETALSTRIWPPAAEEDLARVEAERQTRSVVSTTIAEGTELLENLPDEQTAMLLQKVDTPTSHKGQAVRAPTAEVQEPSQSSPTVTLSPTTEAFVEALISEGEALLGKLPLTHGQALQEDIQRSVSPVAQVVRSRTPDSQTKLGSVTRQTNPYLELVLRQVADSIHDPNWQVQRKALAIVSAAVRVGQDRLVADSCKHVVPLVFRKSPESTVEFVLSMHRGIKAESNVNAQGEYYIESQVNSDKTLVQERMRRTEADIASTLATFNFIAPAMGGPKQNKETFTIEKGTVDLSFVAQRAEALEATREWIPDIPLQRLDMILVGPERRLVQVTDLLALKGGLEIYGVDKHGNHVYLPANSPLPEHKYVHAAGQRRAGGANDSDIEGAFATLITPCTLPVISSAAARQLPRGHKFNTGAAFGGGVALAKPVDRTHKTFVPVSDTHRELRRRASPDVGMSGQSLFSDSLRGGQTSTLRDTPQKPQYGYAGNRSFTPEARFRGVMDFLTEAPAESHASYTDSKLGDFYQNDLAANRHHYMDPLDHNQICAQQDHPHGLLQESAHVPRVVTPGTPGFSHTTIGSGIIGSGSKVASRTMMEFGSRMGTSGSLRGGSQLNSAAGSRLNTADKQRQSSARDTKPVRVSTAARAGTPGTRIYADTKIKKEASGVHMYAETFKLDDLSNEFPAFVTYEVPRKQLPIGRPVSPKYATAVQRGGKMLTAARAKSFLDSVFKKQVEELRMQSFGTGGFDRVLSGYSGPTPDQIYEEMLKTEHEWRPNIQTTPADQIPGQQRGRR